MDEANPAFLLSWLSELRDVLHLPGGVQQQKRVNALAMLVARRAPNPSIRELAMRVMSEAAKMRRAEHGVPQHRDLNGLLEQLRVAIAEVASKPSP
jgi:hypothetical protein